MLNSLVMQHIHNDQVYTIIMLCQILGNQVYAIREVDTVFKYTRKGWCPRTGGGQRLMNRKAVNESIVLATCQDKYSE